MSEPTAELKYVITRAFKDGKSLTSAQRISSTFAEEPVVLGKVLRRGSKPLTLSAQEFLIHEAKLVAQEKAGAILIQRPETIMMKPCEKCGQVARGQGGEFKCPACGLPLVFDPNQLPEIPVSTPASAPVEQKPVEQLPPEPAPELPTAPPAPAEAPEMKIEEKVEVSESLDTSSKSKKKKA